MRDATGEQADRFEPPRVQQLLLRLAKGPLGAPSLGDVAQDALQVERPTLFVANERDVDLADDLAAVLVEVEALVERDLFAFEDPSKTELCLGAFARLYQVGRGETSQVGRLEPEHVEEAPVAVEDPLIEPDQDDRVVGLLEERTVALLQRW